MKRVILIVSIAILSQFISGQMIAAPAIESAQFVEDFALLDHQGNAHKLYYYANDDVTKAIVLIVQGNGCLLVQKQIPELNKLQKDYPGVVFMMINANSQDSREEIAQEAKKYNISMPILIDDTQLVAEAINITRTAEAIVIQPDTWQIIYRGPISDRLNYQSEKPKAKHQYLRDTLDALVAGKLVAGKTVEPRIVKSPGCRVKILDDDVKKHQQISYSRTIAPLLIKKCVQCHSEGGIGPFAMSSYKKVRGWADMMKEVIVTRQMPPWQADPHIGTFSNDFSLSPEEKKTLVHWVDAGALRGDGPDPLTLYVPKVAGWAFGNPDYIIEIPEQSILAEGVQPYRNIKLNLPFQEDVWVTAFEVRPGNTRVLHHIIAWERSRNKLLASYAPGVQPYRFPKDTGIHLKKGASLRLQLHYTASGRPETDNTQIGLYYTKKQIKTELHSRPIINNKFEIPPNTRQYSVTASHQFKQDAILHSLFPHMHYRGKAMRYEAHYPDGTREALLSVPEYHFNWQRNYNFVQPKRMPKGTVLHVEATWDNSALNHFNPNPDIAIRWGEQTWDEMFYASFKYTIEKKRTNY